MWPLWTLIPGWLLAFVAVFGNGLVIYLISTRPRLRTKTNWVVLSLALADFGVGSVYFPRIAYCTVHDKTCVNDGVIIAFSIGVLFLYASVTNLCVLTLDRYLAIVKPLRYATLMTKERVALLITAAWKAALPVPVLFLILFFATSGRAHELVAKTVIIYTAILCTTVCIVVVCASTRIFLIARQHSRQTARIMAQLNYNQDEGARPSRNHDASATRLVLTIVPVFVLSYILEIYVNVCSFGNLCPAHENALLVNTLTLLLNSAVNPIAYAFFKRELRSELRQLFRCGQRRTTSNSAVHVTAQQH